MCFSVQEPVNPASPQNKGHSTPGESSKKCIRQIIDFWMIKLLLKIVHIINSYSPISPGWIIVVGFIAGVAALVILSVAIATRDK